ncbi:MAG TPA: sulfite exporter TauE/SafE family protein [Symbiobacteriaceae bacterium]|nr:sulfite exporter TauE/SafE family protein [Symbiobacteriaceae bacterium]
MERLILVALIGFIAQMVDGSMGMAYGVTSSSLLLLAGFTPAVASASLHLAEVATTLASGISHRKMGNVDRRVAWTLAIPGAIGGFFGAVFLGSTAGEVIKPVVSIILLVLGASILYRFSRTRLSLVGKAPKLTRWFMMPLGLVAGLCDAIGGGGWGPIVTTTLLSKSEAPPRTIVGSVSISETAVAASATIGFFLIGGWETFSLPWVLALMAGGVLAAPLAAWLVGRFSRNVLGVLVGGVILLTNLRTLVRAASLGTTTALLLYGAVILATLIAFLRVRYTAGRPAATAQAAPADSGEEVEFQAQVANGDD